MGQVQGFQVGYPDPQMGLGAEVQILPQCGELYGARLVGPLVHSVAVVGHVYVRVREGVHRFTVYSPRVD